MDRLFRGVIQVGGTPTEADASGNWAHLQEANLDFQTKEDRVIFTYLRSYYGEMSAPPDFTLVREYFEKSDDPEAVTRLDEVKKAQCYSRTNYLSIVRSVREQQMVREFNLACRDAMVIAEHGRNLEKPVNGKKTLKGVNDAVGFFYEKMARFSQIEAGEKLEGSVSADADEVVEEYDAVARSNRFEGRNLFGMEPIDSVCMGHRTGELWVHCAFSGELKTTLALNYAYNNAYVYGKNIFYVILEMKYRSLRRQLYVIHSSHGKFVTDWYEEDRRKGVKEPYLGLDYRKVRDGELDETEYKRFRIVTQDFKATCKGHLYIWHPHEPVSNDDIRRKSEIFHAKVGCDGLIVDYLALVKPKYRTSDFLASLNAVVRECQMTSGNFARGRGVPLLALFQMNRQGKLRADKADGRYDFAAITHANEIEKAADVITYTYLNDQLRKEGKFYLGNLKNRDNPAFERMVGKILWRSKRMRAMETSLLDLDNDGVLEAARHMSISMDDIIGP